MSRNLRLAEEIAKRFWGSHRAALRIGGTTQYPSRLHPDARAPPCSTPSPSRLAILAPLAIFREPLITVQRRALAAAMNGVRPRPRRRRLGALRRVALPSTKR